MFLSFTFSFSRATNGYDNLICLINFGMKAAWRETESLAVNNFSRNPVRLKYLQAFWIAA